MQDIGERTVRVRTKRIEKDDRGEIVPATLKFRVCNASKLILSVSQMVDSGMTVVFSRDRSYLKCDNTDTITTLVRRRGVYEIDYELQDADGRIEATDLSRNCIF